MAASRALINQTDLVSRSILSSRFRIIQNVLFG